VLFSREAFSHFDQGLVEDVKRLTSSSYKIDGDDISTPVQILNMMGHKLEKVDDDRQAQNMAETILGITTTGQGVGGYRKAAPGVRVEMTGNEKALTITALTEAVRYLTLKGLLDEKVLNDYITRMVVATIPEGEVTASERLYQQHATHVSTLLYTAWRKARRELVDKDGLLGVIHADENLKHVDWLLGNLENDAYWRYANRYLTEVRDEVMAYNAVRQRELAEQATAEEADDSAVSVQATHWPTIQVSMGELRKNGNIEAWSALTTALETTVIDRKAEALAASLKNILIKATPLKDIFAEGVPDTGLKQQIIRAIVAVEKFRTYETGQGGLDKIDPTVWEYKDDTQDPENQAILMALVSSIDSYLYNPASTLEDLHRLFAYQTNDSLWRSEVRESAKRFGHIINDQLISTINRTKVAINDRQRIILDQKAMQRPLMYYGVPEFNVVSGDMNVQRKFMLYFPSSATDLQCGFFSLGIPNHTPENVPDATRNAAIKQVTDNLANPEIFAMADRVSGVSSRIKALMERAERRKSMSPDAIEAEIQGTIRDRIEQALEAVPQNVRIQMDIEIAQKVAGLPRPPSLLPLPKDETDEAKIQSIVSQNISIQAEIDRINAENKIKAEQIRREIESTKEARETTEKKEIPNRVTKLVRDIEASDNAETNRLFQTFKTNHELTEVGEVLRDAILAAYAQKIEGLKAEAEAIEAEFDETKAAAGFPPNTPDDREISVWLKYQEKHDPPIPLSSLEIVKRTADDTRNLQAYANDLGLRDVVMARLTFPMRKRIDEITGKKEEASRITTEYSDELRLLKIPYEQRKLAVYSQLIHDFYAGDDFKKLVEKDMKDKFQSGELEFDPNKDWRFVVPTYPAIMGVLNSYNIYAWVTSSQFSNMQAAKGADRNATPIFKTEDDQYVLTNFLPVSRSAKRIGLLNKNGGHFEKWIEADDYPRLARAIRHNQKYGFR